MRRVPGRLTKDAGDLDVTSGIMVVLNRLDDPRKVVPQCVHPF